MNKKTEPKATKYPLKKDIGISDPKTRLKSVTDFASTVEIDDSIPPSRYYRSGVEMIRMAKMYMKDIDYENAYILYVKFITLFVDKIRNHPQYNSVSVKDKTLNKKNLRIAMDTAEELKKLLLEQYQVETNIYMQELLVNERIRQEQLKQEGLQKLKAEEKGGSQQPARTSDEWMDSTMNALVSETPIGVKPERVKVSIDIAAQTSKTSIEKKTPIVDRSTKPSLLVRDNLALRDVIFPHDLMYNFITLASSNTANNKETCGILAGKLEKNQLLITHLLIPEQTGSPDSCVTHNEEDIFNYQDQHNLITLGWIHTHPTQTAFLSSVDLHTHCSYQLMLSEALAIVCAPKYFESKYFILTPDYGLDFIAGCRETGFHPHPTEPPLYMEAKHCKLDLKARIEVVDLRRK